MWYNISIFHRGGNPMEKNMDVINVDTSKMSTDELRKFRAQVRELDGRLTREIQNRLVVQHKFG